MMYCISFFSTAKQTYSCLKGSGKQGLFSCRKTMSTLHTRARTCLASRPCVSHTSKAWLPTTRPEDCTGTTAMQGYRSRGEEGRTPPHTTPTPSHLYHMNVLYIPAAISLLRIITGIENGNLYERPIFVYFACLYLCIICIFQAGVSSLPPTCN